MSYRQLVENLTPEGLMAEFPDLEVLAHRNGSASSNSQNSVDDLKLFAGHNEEQIRLMDEACICVDYNDVPYAAGSKKICHKMTSIHKGLLHRAFSVFLFNSKGQLLLQQRADEKITFANQWTNTCCSHPLAMQSEMGSDLESAVDGVKNAAIRKLEHELGIPPEQVPFEGFHFITRIHYVAPSNDAWGEHEVDYILFITCEPTVSTNKNEVKDWKWVSKDELREMFQDPKLSFTPWFKLICENYLFKWWGTLPASSSEIFRMI